MDFFSPEQTSTNYLVPAKLRASRNIGGSFAHPQTKTTHAGNGAPGCRYARFANGTPRRSQNDAREQKGHLGTDNFGFVRSKFSAAFGGFGRQKTTSLRPGILLALPIGVSSRSKIPIRGGRKQHTKPKKPVPKSRFFSRERTIAPPSVPSAARGSACRGSKARQRSGQTAPRHSPVGDATFASGPSGAPAVASRCPTLPARRCSRCCRRSLLRCALCRRPRRSWAGSCCARCSTRSGRG